MQTRLFYGLTAILTLFTLAQAGRPQYSVGFELSLDYATASINFANGTYADVAKIRGTDAYKQAMRDAVTSYLNRDQARYELEWESYKQELDSKPGVLPMHRYDDPLGNAARRLCPYLPTWLWIEKPTLDPATEAFVPMFESLKSAVEARTGGPDTVQWVGVSMPFRLTAPYHKSLHLAASKASLSLFSPFNAGSWTGIFAAMAQDGLAGDCYGWVDGLNDCDPAQLVLTVGYTEAALTALLLYENQGVFELVRSLHNETIGAGMQEMMCDSLEDQMILSSHDDQQDCTTDLIQALLNITKLPLEKDENFSRGQEISHISRVVLHGESTQDFRLGKVLQEIFPGLTSNGTHGIQLHDQNPVFAAARGMALDGWWQIDFGPEGCDCNDFQRRRACW